MVAILDLVNFHKFRAFCTKLYNQLYEIKNTEISKLLDELACETIATRTKNP